MVKKSIALGMFSALVAFSIQGHKAFADSNYQNPPYQEIDHYLTESALQHNIPPEVVKAVALQESWWDQFRDGEPYISSDGGIGIMQVTNDSRFDAEKLKTDYKYNIDAGVQILDEKFLMKDLPKVNLNDRNILESWYFAILSYNGRSPRNLPINSDGSRKSDAYQEQVYSKIDTYNNGMGIYPVPFQFSLGDFSYTGSSGTYLTFNEKQYNFSKGLLHPTKYRFSLNDLVLSAEGSNYRSTTSSESERVGGIPLGTREVLTIQSPFQFDTTYKIKPSEDMRYRQYAWYKVKRPDGSTVYTASGDLKPLGKRLSGQTRYETAAAVSQQGWPNGADTVVLAKGQDFPDALAGTPLAYSLDAPLLLTENTLHPTTKLEILRLKPKRIILLGGTGAISDRVITELKNMGLSNLTVERYGGSNRFDTASIVASHISSKGDTAILAYGYNFPDALSIAPYAAKNHLPIFLTGTNVLPKETINALKGYKKVIVVGDEGVIGQEVYSQLTNPSRFGGITRYDTNTSIIRNLPMGENTQSFVTTGLNFADALTGAVLAAKMDSHLLLTLPKQLPAPTESFIKNSQLDYFYLLGGEDVVGVQNQIGTLVNNGK